MVMEIKQTQAENVFYFFFEIVNFLICEKFELKAQEIEWLNLKDYRTDVWSEQTKLGELWPWQSRLYPITNEEWEELWSQYPQTSTPYGHNEKTANDQNICKIQ